MILSHEVSFDNYCTSPVSDNDEYTEFIEAMEGASHYAFQAFLEFVKVAQPR